MVRRCLGLVLFSSHGIYKHWQGRSQVTGKQVTRNPNLAKPNASE